MRGRRTDVAVAFDGDVVGKAGAGAGAAVHAGETVGVEVADVADASASRQLSFVTALHRLDAAVFAVEFHRHAVERRACDLTQAFAHSIAY